MRRILLPALVVFSLGFVSARMASGQVRSPYYSLGGFGSVLFPGTGHAPVLPPGGITAPYFPSRLGATVAGRPFGYGSFGRGIDHPGGHGRTVIVPYPVYYGGYGYDQSAAYSQPGGYPQDTGAPPLVNANTAPSVVINQNFIPERSNAVVREYGAPGAPPDADQPSGMKLYQAPPSHPYADAQAPAQRPPAAASHAADEQPTLYLIAFRDHSIVQALGYWMESGTLHYVSVEHSLNQASIDLIDRPLSQRLNDERGVEFKLPSR